MMLKWFKKPSHQDQLYELLGNFNKLTALLVQTAQNHEERITKIESNFLWDGKNDKSKSNS